MNLKIKKLFSYYKPYKKAIALNLLFTVLAGVAELAIPLIVRCVTNEILNFETNKALKIITILSTIVVTLLMILYKTYNTFWQKYSRLNKQRYENGAF